MKILLLEHPRKIDMQRCNDIANTPLSSSLLTGYAAGMLLKEGHEVEIVEGYLDSLSFEEIAERLRAFKPDILGVHMVYSWKMDIELFIFLNKAKEEGLAPYITAYGFYPTIAFDDILHSYPAIDAVIVGEPELTFAELAGALAGQTRRRIQRNRKGAGAAPDRLPAGDIPGLAGRGGSGKAGYLPRPPVADLDRLPFPVRTEAMYRLPEVNLQGSRGCYGRCTFCYINPFYGRGSRWRGRSPENIVAEIDGIIAQRDKKDFYFTDPNFFGPGQGGQKRALHLAALLKPRGIRFGIEARVNDIHDETIGALVEAGLRHILIGLESGNDHALQRMNKMTTVAQNERALRILRKHGLEPNIGFIMFEPDSSIEDVRENFNFLQRNGLLQNLPITANLLYHHQIILKGTPAYRSLKEAGRLEIPFYSNYEAVPIFADRRVETLAEIMRRITNIVFTRLGGIWSGQLEEPQNASQVYAKINGLLVEWFATLLTGLAAGEQFSEEERDAFVSGAERAINEALPFGNWGD